MKKFLIYSFFGFLFLSACAGETLIGGPAPLFSLDTFDGGRVELAGLKGKPVILYFFASW